MTKLSHYRLYNIFSESYPNSKFYRFMNKVQISAMFFGLAFFAIIALRLIFKF